MSRRSELATGLRVAWAVAAAGCLLSAADVRAQYRPVEVPRVDVWPPLGGGDLSTDLGSTLLPFDWQVHSLDPFPNTHAEPLDPSSRPSTSASQATDNDLLAKLRAARVDELRTLPMVEKVRRVTSP